MNTNRAVITVAVLVLIVGVVGVYRYPANAQSSFDRPAGVAEHTHGDWAVVLQNERSKGNGDVNGYLINTRTGEAFFISNEKRQPLTLK